jgi:anti-sigma factor RsiW
MMEKCFDEGTIQAFLDGELASDAAEKVACHVALCNDCAVALAFAEEESSFAFAALDTDLNALVPTERIRTRLFETISAEKKTFWQRIFGKGFRWTSPHIAAFASLVFVVTAFAVLFGVRENSLSDNDQIAQVPAPRTQVQQSLPVSSGSSVQNPQTGSGETVEPQPIAPPEIQRAAHQPKNEYRVQTQKAVFRINNSIRTTPNPPIDAPPRPTTGYAISDEETYVRTIATLTKTVEGQKDEIMRPSTRVAFERDLAVVNDAISKMRQEVRKNPKNEVAKEVLRASYQNKIDLLNSVAEKNELMASLK